MWSLKSVGRQMSVFSFTVSTWFMNEQPPGSRDQPTSSTANQPLAVFQSKCIHCAHFTPLCVDGELLQTEGMSKNMETDKAGVLHSHGSAYYDVQELCWHILLIVETWQLEVNWSRRSHAGVLVVSPSPFGSCASFPPKQLCCWGSVVSWDCVCDLVSSGVWSTNTIAKDGGESAGRGGGGGGGRDSANRGDDHCTGKCVKPHWFSLEAERRTERGEKYLGRLCWSLLMISS